MIYKNNIQNIDKINTIIFDIDGTVTLYNTQEKLFIDTLNFFNIPIKEEYAYEITNSFKKMDDFFNQEKYLTYDVLFNAISENANFLKKYNINVKTFTDKLLENERKYITTHGNTANMLDELANMKINKVCFTNWFYDQANAKLIHTGIRNKFKKIYTIEDRFPKPNKDSYNMLLKEENIPASCALMIGDSKCDLLSNAVGIQSILIDYNKSKKEELYNIADAVISDPMDIIHILNNRSELL